MGIFSLLLFQRGICWGRRVSEENKLRGRRKGGFLSSPNLKFDAVQRSLFLLFFFFLFAASHRLLLLSSTPRRTRRRFCSAFFRSQKFGVRRVHFFSCDILLGALSGRSCFHTCAPKERRAGREIPEKKSHE